MNGQAEQLSRYASDITSQSGEDGILKEIFQRIGATSKICVEFGAWDGRYLSNVWDLWANQGWNAVLIEADEERFQQLRRNTSGYPNVNAVCAVVGEDGPNRLDTILGRLGLGTSIDLLSIDIDGNDYAIWESLTEHSARVVVIEYNPTVPPHIQLVGRGVNHVGSSAAALVSLGHSKGYDLVTCSRSNCIFVQSGEFPKLGIPQPDLASVFVYDNLTYVMSSYVGDLMLSRQPTFFRARSRIRSIAQWCRALIRGQSVSASLGLPEGTVQGPMPVPLYRLSPPAGTGLKQ